MSYQAEIAYNDYKIAFEYEYDTTGLTLVSWVAYEGPHEVAIPCRLESEFIESQLNKWLDNEFNKNSFNYEEDKQIALMMKKCEY